jgi:hypothetical protein
MTLHDRIMRARQAQVEHEQRYDVQLAAFPFPLEPSDPNFTTCDHDTGRPISAWGIDHDRSTDHAHVWTTEDEYRDEWHRKFDDEWREWIHAHYDREG